MVCQQCNIILYSDDTVIFTHGENDEDVANKLTDVLAKIISWLNQCYRKINASKTASMLFSKGHSADIKQDIFILGERLQVVSGYKYLRVHLESCLGFKTHIKNVCEKGQI